MMRTMKLALIQMSAGLKRAANLEKAEKLIGEAAGNGAALVILPESFASPYGTEYFADYAEQIPGTTSQILSDAARKYKINIIGGSIIEKDGNKIYNTCTVYDTTGNMISKFRKLHLFDINIPGKMTFKESDVLSAGNELAVVKIDDWNVGLGICYDVRFGDMARAYRQTGCDLLVYPGAFNMTTGPAHWELLARGRALDNQLYVVMCSVARDMEATYTAWGHSMIVDPWGTVTNSLNHEEAILYCNIDHDRVEEVRTQIAISTQTRNDLYSAPRGIVYSSDVIQKMGFY